MWKRTAKPSGPPPYTVSIRVDGHKTTKKYSTTGFTIEVWLENEKRLVTVGSTYKDKVQVTTWEPGKPSNCLWFKEHLTRKEPTP